MLPIMTTTRAKPDGPAPWGTPSWERSPAHTTLDLRGLSGKKEQTIFWPWGLAQPLEKSEFGEGKPRISFALFWPGFAG